MIHQDFQTIENNKILGLRPSAFIRFLELGDPDETLALLQKYYFFNTNSF